MANNLEGLIVVRGGLKDAPRALRLATSTTVLNRPQGMDQHVRQLRRRNPVRRLQGERLGPREGRVRPLAEENKRDPQEVKRIQP